MLTDVLVLGLASGLLSTTLTQGEIFERPRGWIAARSPWWGKLTSCSFCMGHWTAAGLVGWYAVVSPTVTAVGAFGVMWLAVTGVSALVSGVIGRVYGE